MTGSLLLDLLVVAAAAAGLGYLLFRVLVQGKQLYGRDRERESSWDSTQQSAIDLARRSGWQVDEHPDRSWPEDLRSVREDGRTCLLVLSGPDFEASSWAAKEKMVGALAGAQSRLWLLRLRAPEVRHSLFVRRSARGQEELLLPTRFQGRVAVEEPIGGLFAGGDYREAEDLLGPLVEQVRASGSWILTAPGDVTVMATLEPDASGLEFRLRLAREVAAALSR